MKRKKLFSTAVAGMLVAVQMVMPVMATDGGEVDVDVTTRTAVIRVEVPTSLAIAVNQFEKGDAGSQIYSDNFTITNKSEIPVKVSVTSEATLATTTTLVSTKDDAEDPESESPEAWLAMAAMVADRKYIDDTEDNTLGIKDLDETMANVVTFVQDETTPTKATAEQIFYLATETTPAVTYTLAKDADGVAAAKKISYAQFYEVEAKAAADQDALDALLAAGNVFVDNGTTVSLVEKGEAHTKTDGETYYTLVIAADATEPARVEAANLTNNKMYVYGAAGEGGKAGFRYIGKLSEGKETWVAADINHVKITYEITGVTTTKYDTLKNDCTYGLYTGTGSGSTTTATEVNGVKVMNSGGSTTYSTGADVAARLKAGAVQFVLDSATATKVKNDSLSVTKIVIDGKDYTPTVTANSKADSNSDGNTYAITGFTADTVSTIELYYGTDLIVKYTF